jgi:hypothetical protein
MKHLATLPLSNKRELHTAISATWINAGCMKKPHEKDALKNVKKPF